jgi:DNA polymerase III epsilon subunit-like protein
LFQIGDKFLVCDLETTHREPSKAEIISGHFMYLDSSLAIIEEYEFKSQVELWDKNAQEASQIHGITYQDMLSFPAKYQAMDDLCNWLSTLKAGHFVAHGNRKIFGKFYTFDYSALCCNLLDADYYFEFSSKFRPKDIISTHSLAKALSIASKYDLKSLSQYFKLSDFNHHDAKSDCVICYELLKKMIPQIDLKEFFEAEYYNTKELSNDSKPRKTKKRSSKI